VLPQDLTLALDFLDEHPEEAVRTLEQHDVAHVAAFLAQVPASYSALVLGLALPAFAAHLCALLEPGTAARLLLQHGVSRTVSVLRHLEHGLVDAILTECPQSRRHACQLLMMYPLDTAGAWMVPNTAVVTADFSVQEVLNFLKDATEETVSKYVFVVDRAGMPLGRVSYLRLLKAGAEEQLGRLMEASPGSISGRMPLVQAARLPCWEQGDVMPVTGAQQQFIGVLRHMDLRQGLRQNQIRRPQRTVGSDPVSGIIDVYGKSLLALFDSVSHAVDSSDRT
jgi:Mg/Co/Ni transporter MgtE